MEWSDGWNISPSDSLDSNYSRTPLIRTLVIRIASHPDRLDPSGEYVENSTKLTCLEITCYRMEYSTFIY